MLKIELQQPDACFAPGDAIKGIVQWEPLPEKASALDIRLIWYTQGKGDTDVDIAANQEVVKTEPSVGGEATFEFVAPHRPYSFAGKLIELTWAIELLDKNSLDSVIEKLVIHPNKQQIELTKSFDDSLAKRAEAKPEVTPQA